VKFGKYMLLYIPLWRAFYHECSPPSHRCSCQVLDDEASASFGSAARSRPQAPPTAPVRLWSIDLCLWGAKAAYIACIPSEADLHQKLASLEAQVALLHHQLARLTSVLLGQQTSVDPPQASLSALVPPTGPLWPCSAELAQEEGISQVVAGPRPYPAESRRRPLLPLIEYGACTYIVICPQVGELHLGLDSQTWRSTVWSRRLPPRNPT
jgi:uncharacterized coiled-coil protein SlyX